MHSWGLEAAIARRLVADAPTLEHWTRQWLTLSLAPLEGVVVASVCRAAQAGDGATIRRAAEILGASLNPPTTRRASLQIGEQLASLGSAWEWSRGRFEHLVARPHHAVVFGALAALAQAGAHESLAAYLHQSALGMISAGVRALPVGHTHGQQILAYLHDDIHQLAATIPRRELEAAGASCPYYEVLCDEQARLFTRLF